MYSLLMLAALLAADPEAIEIEGAQVTIASQVQVSAREAGTLQSLAVSEGDFVEVGTLIGKLDGKVAELERMAAAVEHEIAGLQSENDVDRRFAAKSHKVAEAELARSLESVELYDKSVSKTELDKLRLSAERARLSIEQAERDIHVASLTASLKKHSATAAEVRLDRRQIISPLAGMVVQRFHQAGEWLNPGESVVRIVALDRLRVEAFVDGNRYGSELLKRPVELKVTLPPGDLQASYRGTITFVSPELQPVTGQMRVWAEVENHDLKLRPGMRGVLVIEGN